MIYQSQFNIIPITKGGTGATTAEGALANLGAVSKPSTYTENNLMAFDADGNAIDSKTRVCNPNLLENWYFINPVNQRGQTEYTAFNSYCIDRWIRFSNSTISLVNDGLKIAIAGSGGSAFQQRIEGYRLIEGCRYTMTYLLNDGSLYTDSFSPLKTGEFFNYLSFRNVYNTIKYYSDYDYWTVELVKQWNDTAEDMTIVAVKLELGDTQTLAHQENGVWVLNEIPNYADEFAKCAQYDCVTGEYIGYRHINPNLLDNGDFQVWQRGESFTHTGSQGQIYFADRWKSVSTFTGTAEKTTDGIKFTSTEVSYINLIQLFEVPANLKGKTVTLTTKVKGTASTGFNIIHHITNINNILNFKESTFSGDWEIFTFTFNLSTDDIQGINISARNNCLDYNIAWVKLEVGDVATPFIPKDYNEEFEACQKYFMKFGTYCGLFGFTVGSANSNSSIVNLNLPCRMRGLPVVSYNTTNVNNSVVTPSTRFSVKSVTASDIFVNYLRLTVTYEGSIPAKTVFGVMLIGLELSADL